MTRQQPNKFAQRRAATRKALIQLGLERLPVKGYNATTIEDLVRDSGLTRGAFHFHFESREDYFMALLQERAAVRTGWWNMPDAGTPLTLEAAVGLALSNLATASGKPYHDWLPLIIEFTQSVRTDPDHAHLVEELYRQWIAEARQLVDYLADRNLVRTDRTHDELAASVFAYAEGNYLHLALYGAQPGEQVLDGMVRLLAP